MQFETQSLCLMIFPPSSPATLMYIGIEWNFPLPSVLRTGEITEVFAVMILNEEGSHRKIN